MGIRIGLCRPQADYVTTHSLHQSTIRIPSYGFLFDTHRLGRISCITTPPVSAPTVNGFFPLLRWVFCAELISEALTRHKRLLESQIWWWRLVARS